MTEYKALTVDEAQKLISNYQERINSAFDAMSKVQDAAMNLIDKIVYEEKTIPFGTRRLVGFNNVLHMMSPYTKLIPTYMKQRKKGLIKDNLPQEMINEMEMIASEALDWRAMFNAEVKHYKETWNDYRMQSKMKGWL